MSKDKSVVLVTGATGFVGRNLVSALMQEGWTVRRAVRTRTQADDVWIETIGPDTDWQCALNGVDAVVHLAARVHHPNEENAGALYRQINFEGTRKLAQAAASSSVTKFIYISTILVNGSTTDGRAPFGADDKCSPRGVYGASKKQAEQALEQIALQTAMKISIVRPPLIYGPGARGNFQYLVKALKLHLPIPLASVRNRRAFISVQNLVSFISHQLSNEEMRFSRYLIADAEQVSTPDFIARMANAMNTRAYLLPFPPKVLGSSFYWLGRPELRDSVFGSLEIDISSALSTGWHHVLTMDEGLQVAVNSHPDAQEIL